MSLQKLKTLTPLQQRKAAAILGALVADAASTPLHWIYNQDKVKELTSSGTIEFYPTSQSPYYHVPTGTNSPYGSQIIVTLRDVAQNKGFDSAKLADALYKEFGPGTIYEKVRQTGGQPKEGPWTKHSLKIFIANREDERQPEADPTSKSPDGLLNSVVVVSLLSGQGDVVDKAVECVQTIQSNPAVTDFAKSGAALLDSVIQTGEYNFEAAIAVATQDVADALKSALEAKGKPHEVAVKEFGLPCGLPASFQGMIQGIASATSYTQAIRDGILSGGDNCSRNCFIGACVAAKYGLDSIPEDWLKKYDFADEVLGHIETIVTL